MRLWGHEEIEGMEFRGENERKRWRECSGRSTYCPLWIFPVMEGELEKCMLAIFGPLVPTYLVIMALSS